MTFSAIGNDNTCLWGTHRSEKELEEERMANATATPTATPVQTGGEASAAKPTVSSQTTTSGIKKRKVVKKRNLTYRVTNITRREVEVIKSANKKKIVVPATIKINGSSYKVTSIASKAFYKMKSIKKIVIKGTKIKKIGKKAFTGINKKAVIKVPKKKKKSYRKLLNKKTGVLKTMKLK